MKEWINGWMICLRLFVVQSRADLWDVPESLRRWTTRPTHQVWRHLGRGHQGCAQTAVWERQTRTIISPVRISPIKLLEQQYRSSTPHRQNVWSSHYSIAPCGAGAPLFPLVHLLPHLFPPFTFLILSLALPIFFFCSSLPFLPE